MFSPLIRRVDREEGVKSRKLRYYFDRHVEMMGTPMETWPNRCSVGFVVSR